MLEEKLKDAIVAELKRQAANDPQSLKIESSECLVVNGRIDLDDLVMVLPAPLAVALAWFPLGEQEPGLSPNVLQARRFGWCDDSAAALHT